MFFYSLASLIPLTIVLALAVVSMRAIWLAVMPPRRCVKEASCEKCKYPVAGLSTWTCPECGSHLLTVGIVTRSMEMRRRGSYVGAIGGLLFLHFLAVIIGLGVIAATLGSSAGMFGNTVYITSTTLTPVASGIAPIDLVNEQNWAGRGPTTIIRLQPSAGSSRDEMTIDVNNGLEYQYTNPTDGRTHSGSLDSHAILNWMAARGVKADGPAAKAQATELVNYLTGPDILNGTSPTGADLPSFNIGVMSTTTRPIVQSAHAYFWFIAAMWSAPILGLLLFGVFTFLIIRRRRRLLRDASVQESLRGVPPLAPPTAPA